MLKQYETARFNGSRHSVGGSPGASPTVVFGPVRTGGQVFGGADLRVRQSIDYMVANLNRPLRVASLAAQVNVSPSHFFALFKQETGLPPIDYFTKLRMGEACRLLDSTAASVKEVAASLGYDDPFYFSRVFKSRSAVAPLHYRGLGAVTRQEIRNRLGSKRRVRIPDPQPQTKPSRQPPKRVARRR
jgi:AraC-like DNA-binding protein